MKVEFLSDFSKDLDSVSAKLLRQKVIRLIVRLELAKSLNEIPNTKKLKGHKSAYRIRLGDYRVGLFLEDQRILLARFVHRKDIYKLFP